VEGGCPPGAEQGRNEQQDDDELPPGHGLDALSGDYVDMIDTGVIDAAKVTLSALQSAVSIAALLLTTEALVAEELVAQPGAVLAPGFGDLAEGIARPSSPAGSPAPSPRRSEELHVREGRREVLRPRHSHPLLGRES
jgi:hypothetical protein